MSDGWDKVPVGDVAARQDADAYAAYVDYQKTLEADANRFIRRLERALGRKLGEDEARHAAEEYLEQLLRAVDEAIMGGAPGTDPIGVCNDPRMVDE